jgi:hypothetical protein
MFHYASFHVTAAKRSLPDLAVSTAAFSDTLSPNETLSFVGPKGLRILTVTYIVLLATTTSNHPRVSTKMVLTARKTTSFDLDAL